MLSWQNVTTDGRLLKNSIESLHQVAQFLAMVSNSYLPRQPDDTQNSFKWNPETNYLEGEWLKHGNIRMLLDVVNFELVIDKYLSYEIIALDGWSKEQIIGNIQNALKQYKLNAVHLKPISQFKLPYNEALVTHYSKPSGDELKEWARWLNNTYLILEEIKSKIDSVSDIRVWPHHFDMGCYIPIEHDLSGNLTKTVGIGLAIPDAYVPEPYYYINHWSTSSIQYTDTPPKMRHGYWHRKDWNGLVLPSSVVLAQRDQYQVCRSFFLEGISTTLTLLKKAIKPIS